MDTSDRSQECLEPATSIGSTVSDSEHHLEHRPHHRSTFEEDDSDSSHSEDARHDQRADLQRMMSRRTFAVNSQVSPGVVGGADGLRHRARLSTGHNGAETADSDGQHGPHRRRASTGAALETNGAPPPEDQPQAYQVRARGPSDLNVHTAVSQR